MLPGNQIYRSLELLAKVELDDGTVSQPSLEVKQSFSPAPADTDTADEKRTEIAKLERENGPLAVTGHRREEKPVGNSAYDRIPLKTKTATPTGYAGIMLEVTNSGRTFVRTAFYDIESNINEWLKKTISRRSQHSKKWRRAVSLTTVFQ